MHQDPSTPRVDSAMVARMAGITNQRAVLQGRIKAAADSKIPGITQLAWAEMEFQLQW
jgi:hypothetical protein